MENQLQAMRENINTLRAFCLRDALLIMADEKTELSRNAYDNLFHMVKIMCGHNAASILTKNVDAVDNQFYSNLTQDEIAEIVSAYRASLG